MGLGGIVEKGCRIIVKWAFRCGTKQACGQPHRWWVNKNFGLVWFGDSEIAFGYRLFLEGEPVV